MALTDGEHDSALARAMGALALEAGAAALEIYRSDFTVDAKNDASPVTEADRLGEEIILEGLSRLAPEIQTLAEEAASAGKIPTLGRAFFLVDPLDGTKEFVTKTGEFTVNIALIRDGRPAIGVVYAPAIGKLYAGIVGAGASLARVADGVAGPFRPIAARKIPARGLVAVASRSHRGPETDAFLSTLDITDFAAAGSSLKFCLIAEGLADVYPRLGRTMEWDTGAGQAVLEAAGGRVVVFGGEEPLCYAKKDRGFDNPHFIAWGRL
ncbi:MAG: 3'(2'),5'-bisphosphate nucleotidase [Alphaproteobacteria bacterium RIFCSPHIGHO2_12_FULL_63_12]|nr:MAG: 3'(2'),5'-bisphosphate nucleotidase [Alphaproteobacteria bacterium RIFCSPHIGHO2_12_FULL_63_12]